MNLTFKSYLRKIGYILSAETIQSTCVQSSINYHRLHLRYKVLKGVFLQKKKSSFTHSRLDTYHFLITLKNYYYQKLRNFFFSSSHCILWHCIQHFSCFSSMVSFILCFAWISMWGKKHLT